MDMTNIVQELINLWQSLEEIVFPYQTPITGILSGILSVQILRFFSLSNERYFGKPEEFPLLMKIGFFLIFGVTGAYFSSQGLHPIALYPSIIWLTVMLVIILILLFG